LKHDHKHDHKHAASAHARFSEIAFRGNLTMTMAQTKPVVPSPRHPTAKSKGRGCSRPRGCAERRPSSARGDSGFVCWCLAREEPAPSKFIRTSNPKQAPPQLSPPSNQGSLQLPLLQARVAARSAAKAFTYVGQKAIQDWASKPQLRPHIGRDQSVQQLTESTNGNKLNQ